MRLDLKVKNEDGSINFEGSLNRTEITYLIQYAVNSLMVQGALFDLTKEVSEDESRIKMPGNTTLQ